MPFTYGGGITSLDIAKKVFDCGVEKISVNSAAINDHKLITEISKKFGSQSVVVSIDIKKNLMGRKSLYDHSSKKFSAISPLKWAKQVEGLGAGEILLTFVDNEGMWKGLDIPLINEANIKGIAINFRRLIKIVPKGLNQSLISSDPNDVWDIKSPNITPATIPMIIFQCSFIIIFLRVYLIRGNQPIQEQTLPQLLEQLLVQHMGHAFPYL